MEQIAIIGAGLSGRLLALNLLRSAPADGAVGITLLDRDDEGAMGPAYSNDADDMLLNVPAGRMGAFSDDEEHFLRWCRRRGFTAGELDFLPRRWYRDYIFDLLREARQATPAATTLRFIRGEVTDVAVADARATVHVAGKETLPADKIVLAPGNFPPRHPAIATHSTLQHRRYVRNPWAPGVLDAMARNDTVFLIGTGQTTVDIAAALRRRAHEGRIIALSRRGLLPLAHGRFDAYDSFFNEIGAARTIRAMFRVVRRHIERADSLAIDRRAVIDALRPDTQTLWAGLAEDEKRRFLRHVFRYWETIRSRIPPQSKTVIDTMRADGQLEIIAGRIRDLIAKETAMEVHYAPRGRSGHGVEAVDWVLNCIGPEADYARVEQPLVRNLLRRGLIRPGPARIGMDALSDGAIIGQDGAASSVLYTLGSTMKGVLWEVLAVPEIRVQAELLARQLLGANR